MAKRIRISSILRTAAAAGTLLLLPVLAGCSKGAKAGNVSDLSVSAETGKNGAKQKVVFWMSMQTPDRDAFMQNILDEFRTQNPDIDLEFLGVPGNIVDFKTKLDMAYSTGTAPDVHDVFISELISRKNIQPLDSYFASWADKDNFSPSVIEELRNRDVKDHHLYAIPATTVTRNFWIRSDWLAEKNLKAPETWNDFFTVAQKLTDKKNGRYGHSIRGGAGGAQNLEYMMYSYSGITDSFTADGKSTINDPLHVEFVQKYLSLYHTVTPDDDLTKGWTELAATFASGTAASVFHNTGSAPTLEKTFNGDYSKFELLTFPKSVKGYYVHPVLDPRSYVMSTGCKNPDAAWRLIAFLASKDITSQFGQFYGEIPLNKAASNADWIQTKPYMVKSVAFINRPDVKFFKEPTFLPSYRSILSETAEPGMQSAMLKKTTVKQFLDSWADAMTKAYAEYQQDVQKQ